MPVRIAAHTLRVWLLTVVKPVPMYALSVSTAMMATHATKSNAE